MVDIGQMLSPEKLAFSRDFSRDLGLLVCAVWVFLKTWPATLPPSKLQMLPRILLWGEKKKLAKSN